MKAWYYIGTGESLWNALAIGVRYHPMTAKSDVSEVSLRRGDRLNINLFHLKK